MNIQTKAQLAGTIDHTLLKPTATSDDIRRLCDEAKQYGFATVCVLPRWASFAADILKNTNVKVDSVAGFPFGADNTNIKVAQSKDVIFAGVDEVDMVADLAAVIEGDRRYLTNEFVAVLHQCRIMKPPVILKVIIESAALTTEQKIFVCGIAAEVGVDFIKTSTGFHPAGGATIDDIKLIKQTAPNCKAKAAGGIKTARQALAMLEAGAERIGTSSAVAIIEQFKNGDL